MCGGAGVYIGCGLVFMGWPSRVGTMYIWYITNHTQGNCICVLKAKPVLVIWIIKFEKHFGMAGNRSLVASMICEALCHSTTESYDYHLQNMLVWSNVGGCRRRWREGHRLYQTRLGGGGGVGVKGWYAWPCFEQGVCVTSTCLVCGTW